MMVIKRMRAACVPLLPLLLAALLFAGMFARITMLARLSEKGKQISALELRSERAQIKINQMELMLNELHDLESIAVRAAQLGMKSPDAQQIRVLQPDTVWNTPAEDGHEQADIAWRGGWD